MTKRPNESYNIYMIDKFDKFVGISNELYSGLCRDLYDNGYYNNYSGLLIYTKAITLSYKINDQSKIFTNKIELGSTIVISNNNQCKITFERNNLNVIAISINSDYITDIETKLDKFSFTLIL